MELWCPSKWPKIKVTWAIAAINGVIILFITGRGPPYSQLSFFLVLHRQSTQVPFAMLGGHRPGKIGDRTVVMLVQVSLTWVKMGVSKSNGTPKFRNHPF